MSVPVKACRVAASDVTGGVGGGAVRRVGRVGRAVGRAARIGRHAERRTRISKMFVTTVQRLSLCVVRGTVALEESTLKKKKPLHYYKTHGKNITITSEPGESSAG